MEEQERQRASMSLEAIALQQTVTLVSAQVVAELVQTVSFVGQLEGGQDGLVDLLGRPTADGTAAVEQDLQEPDDARVVDLDAGITNRANRDGEGHALHQREVDMDVEPLRLRRGEAVRDQQELLPDGIEVVQAFLQAEVGEVVGTDFIAQEGEEFFVLLEEGVLAVGARWGRGQCDRQWPACLWSCGSARRRSR